MICPVCNIPTFVVEYQDIELDICPECHGVWFDAGELELLLGDEVPVQLIPADSQEQVRGCPLCPRKMEKVNIGPGRRVLIDVCPAGCGLWFDGREVADLTSDLEESGWRVHPEVREFFCDMFPEREIER